jgi:hypothetical protein
MVGYSKPSTWNFNPEMFLKTLNEQKPVQTNFVLRMQDRNQQSSLLKEQVSRDNLSCGQTCKLAGHMKTGSLNWFSIPRLNQQDKMCTDENEFLLKLG